VIIFILLILGASFFQKDGYKAYADESANRLKEYEAGEVIRFYVSENSVTQIVHTKGYHENLIFKVTISNDQISHFEILSQEETEDYGGYITKAWFAKRLLLSCDEHLEIVKLAKEKANEVVAVTGATISSTAVVVGVNTCIDNYWGYMNEI
jgi:uncharacterized protein with FMN-binding domain